MGLKVNDSYLTKYGITIPSIYISLRHERITVIANHNGTYSVELYYRIYNSKEDADNNNLPLEVKFVDFRLLENDEFKVHSLYYFCYQKLKELYPNSELIDEKYPPE